jgi:hypothetical protein
MLGLAYNRKVIFSKRKFFIEATGRPLESFRLLFEEIRVKRSASITLKKFYQEHIKNDDHDKSLNKILNRDVKS